MTFKQRLMVSNVLMVALPALAAVAMAGACVFAMWGWLFGFADDDAIEQLLLSGVAQQVSVFELKVAIVFSCVLIAITVVLSVWAANRFLAKFAVSQLEETLEEFERGLHALAQGDLGYRIERAASDEFAAACDDFNDMAAKLEERTMQLHEQQAARTRLVADISHDLRSPLTSIKGYAEGVLDGVAATPERQQRYLRTIVAKTDEVLRLVNSLLELSKVQLDEYPVNAQPLRVDRFVARIARECCIAGEGRIGVVVDAHPALALADEALLMRVMGNLLDNCEKYRAGDAAHVRVTVRVARQTGEESRTDGESSLDRAPSPTPGFCAIAVADDGVGVPLEALPHLFDMLYRADSSRHDPGEGSGIGLAFVKRAVELMGGSVCARQNTPHGLIVELTLPLAHGADLLGAGGRAGEAPVDNECAFAADAACESGEGEGSAYEQGR